ncbi:hypothetical protein [Methylobacterium sp. SyP6R]|nr:hypothetical protein [Methylobacterium sp. SyP6R]MCF4128487.1 hypothetical protein [Methylobacterium sp. SyP6R]
MADLRNHSETVTKPPRPGAAEEESLPRPAGGASRERNPTIVEVPPR